MRYAYFDHNATTPLDPRVEEAMRPWLGERFGNPSSIHRPGRDAREAVEQARRHVADLVGARPAEIVFTASGTEANNTVVVTAGCTGGGPGRLVLSALEHPSIRVAAGRLETAGWTVARVPPGADGVVPVEAFRDALLPGTRLACLMLANNELGTLQPVAQVARLCRERGIPLLTDAVQAAGKVPVDVAALGADYLVLGAHKFHGPLGAAALWVRPGAALEPLLVGGGQEGRRRAATENVPAAVGLGEAARLAAGELPERARYLGALQRRFESGLARIPGARIHCASSPRLPQTCHVAFPGLEGEALLLRLDAAGFGISTGSACSSGRPEPSKTLLAMGISAAEALASIRVSFGISNTVEEVDAFLEVLAREVASLRTLLGVAV